MIDLLFKSDIVEKKPFYGVLLGFLFATIGLSFGSLVFRENPSFPSIFLTTLSAAPIAIKLIKKGKLGNTHDMAFGKVFKRHGRAVELYFNLFFGMTIAFAIFYASLPTDTTNILFSEQNEKFASGFFKEQTSSFTLILVNNIGLLIFFFLLSLFYGFGSIFLLSWNASILGVMWGRALKSTILLSILKSTLFAFPYLLPEVLAYFLAAIAGGIVSINLAEKKRVRTAMLDSVALLTMSIMIIVIAGIIEVVTIGYAFR